MINTKASKTLLWNLKNYYNYDPFVFFPELAIDKIPILLWISLGWNSS